MAPSPTTRFFRVFPEAADGLFLDESPHDPFDLSKLLHDQIRSDHHCSQRRAIAIYVLWRLGR